MITTVIVRLKAEGIHCYPQAATMPELADVAFLANLHRHEFHIEAELEVFHDDRELEFILIKRKLQEWVGASSNMNNRSCEMLARDIAIFLTNTYNYTGHTSATSPRYCRVDVFEDGENGARVAI